MVKGTAMHQPIEIDPPMWTTILLPVHTFWMWINDEPDQSIRLMVGSSQCVVSQFMT